MDKDRYENKKISEISTATNGGLQNNRRYSGETEKAVCENDRADDVSGMEEHLGYERNSVAGNNTGNSRNGYGVKTISSD